jgi:tetratricopeptide (TPR) repeat protein
MRRQPGILVLLLLSAIVIGVAQTRQPAPRPSADALASKQFAAALAEYRAQPASTELRDKVIRQARGLKTAPEIPQEARDYFDQAMAQMQQAASPGDIKAAAKLFEQAAQAAPWYAEAYRSLGAVCDKLGDYEKEKEWLRLYISALRDDASVKAGQALLDEVDSRKAQAAAQAAKAELERAMAAVKQNPSDIGTRQKLVKMVSAYNPPLPVPEETERYMARGKAAYDNAKDARDFKDAVVEFQHARDAALWYGPAYYSLGVAHNAAGDYTQAKENLSVYLAWSLNAEQIKATKELIYQIEYLQEKAQRQPTVVGVWEIVSVNYDENKIYIGKRISILRKGDSYEVKTLDGSLSIYTGDDQRIVRTDMELLVDAGTEGKRRPLSVDRQFIGQRVAMSYSYTLSADGNFLTKEQDNQHFYWETNTVTGETRNARYEIDPGDIKATLKRVSQPDR